MALVLADRVEQVTRTTGLADLTLAEVIQGRQSFQSVTNNGDTVIYVLEDTGGAAWEIGTGTVIHGTETTLQRTTIRQSSDAGAKISLNAGTHRVFLVADAEYFDDKVTQADINAAIAAHVALPDPHAQYALETDLAASTGAATLGYDNAASGLAATDVQAAVDEVDGDLDAHIGTGGTAQHPAATVSVAGFMSASDKTKLDTIETDAKDDQSAAEVPYSNATSGLAATDVQAAVDEVDADLDTHIAAGDPHPQYALEADLSNNAATFGSDRVAHTGTADTVTEALDKRVIRKTSVAEIEALTGVADYQVSLSGPRAGIFEFDPSNLSTEVTADTQQGIYIAPSSDPTGASGAWVRQDASPLQLDWFGPDGTRVGDSTAIKAAIAFANNAPIKLEAKRYLWDSSVVISDDFCLQGEQMPVVNAGVTALENGSIIDGEFGFTSSNVELRDMGFDIGADSTAIERDDACRGTAPINAGGRLHTENIVGLCDSRTRSGHALLFQSYQEHTGGNLYGIYSTFGIVIKNQNVNLGLCRSFENLNSGVLLKSDTAFGKLENVYIDRVECIGFLGSDNGFHIQSSDDTARKIQIGSVDCKGFEINTFIQCGASAGQDVRDVTIGEIYSTEAFTNDLVVDAARAGSSILDVYVGRLVTNETKAASVRTIGNGQIYGVSINSTYINYRAAAVQADMDQAIFHGGNTVYTNHGNVDIVRSYFDTLTGTITYNNALGRNIIGPHRARIAGPGSPLAKTYTTTGGTVINIDISQAEEVDIVINALSLSASDKIEWQLSTDDGTTLETGSVYKRSWIDSTQDSSVVGANEFWSTLNNTLNILHGRIQLKGHLQEHPTMWSGFAGSVTDTEARFLAGIVGTTTVYKTLQLQAPTGTFDAVDIVVYEKY